MFWDLGGHVLDLFDFWFGPIELDGGSASSCLLTHDCEPTLNDSGSPLLLRRNGQLTLVGITVATRIAGLSQRGTVLPIDGFAGDVNRALGFQ